MRGLGISFCLVGLIFGCKPSESPEPEKFLAVQPDELQVRALTEIKRTAGGPVSVGFSLADSNPPPVVPDKTVQKVFSFKGSEIKVVGGCSLSGDILSCWSADGKPDPKLTKETNARYAEGGDLFNNRISTQVGKKNRIILYQVSNPTSNFEPRVVGVRDPRFNFSFVEDKSTPAMATTPASEPRTLGITREASDKEGSVIASFIEPLGKSPDLRVVAGNEINFDGQIIRVERISEANSGWLVSLKLSAATGPKRVLDVTALDASGKAITRSDRSGKPVSEAFAAEELKKFRRQLDEDPSLATEGPVFRSAKPIIKSQTDDGITISLNVDPKYVDRIYFSGVRLWKIEIAGIPLDPIKR